MRSDYSSQNANCQLTPIYLGKCMEIISGQQENKASGRIGNEFSLYPFGSPQLFQILENKNGRQWRWGLRVISGPVGLSKRSFSSAISRRRVLGRWLCSNKEPPPFPGGLCSLRPRSLRPTQGHLPAQHPAQSLGSGNCVGKPFCGWGPRANQDPKKHTEN